MMSRFLRIAVGAAALTAANAFAASHVFLVQNSGWMEPFFADPASQYKPLVTELVMAVARPDDLMVLASFNQSQPGAPSPKALMSAKVTSDSKALRGSVSGALQNLEVGRKPNRTTLADTDLNEAVRTAIDQALGKKPGLVWLFTNNKNSPNNDQATAKRNREFYELIHRGQDIRKVLAFPLQMPVKSKSFQANGLMVYVFGIQEQGARDLDALVQSGAIQKIITESPARLKPLDADTVRLHPKGVFESPGVGFSMGQSGVLLADVNSDAKTPVAKVQWALENSIYPYTIAQAEVNASSVLAGERKPITVDKTVVTGLQPGKQTPLSSTLQLPVAQMPDTWSLEAISAAGRAFVLPGTLELDLTGQRLELSPQFRERMAQLFPGDPLPDLFIPPAEVKGSKISLPIQVRVNFGLMPLIALLAAAAAAILATVGALLLATKARSVKLVVDGQPRTVLTKARQVYPIHDAAGRKVAELKTQWFGKVRLTDIREGAQVRLGQ
ncbi:hypothetical protein [Noviherbaspirillum aridicola]|uniref:Uncharacterized protein n=1 Tax=Noviherbaspirillum aridicola TaxID=2849687 RepID=A0ABQ4Q246_9BURK|nr:hypothetical protein [Noviherbaspirillum aridicola]GIZ51116.1 hypothetical protein NCCP691_11300 [Noviherbaspirillum aridicola]